MTDEPLPYADRIVHDPAILVGKPTIKGTRISVELILGFLAHSLDLDELFAAYPRLTVEDVQAALGYASALVDAEYRRERAEAPVASARA